MITTMETITKHIAIILQNTCKDDRNTIKSVINYRCSMVNYLYNENINDNIYYAVYMYIKIYM